MPSRMHPKELGQAQPRHFQKEATCFLFVCFFFCNKPCLCYKLGGKDLSLNGIHNKYHNTIIDMFSGIEQKLAVRSLTLKPLVFTALPFSCFICFAGEKEKRGSFFLLTFAFLNESPTSAKAANLTTFPSIYSVITGGVPLVIH